MRREQSIEERGEPSLIYVTRESVFGPIRLHIVESGQTLLWEVPDDRWIHICADALHMIRSRPKQE